jgi:hypothetical protein
MKSLRSIFIGVAVLGMIIFFSSLSFAEEGYPAGKMNHQANVKLLKDSALALQQSHPELAKGLNDYADKEAKEMQEWKAGHEAKMKLLKDAAAALQQSNPDLAKGLQEMSEGKHKKEMQEMMQEKNEKEEASETVEPKSEQGENTK